MDVPWRNVAGGLEIRLRVTPRSREDEVIGITHGSDGRASLAVKVRALPDKGLANAASIETLSKALNVPKSQMSLVAGMTSRNKTIVVKGESAELERRIAGMLGRCRRGRTDGKDH